jgi:hypothetical protein
VKRMKRWWFVVVFEVGIGGERVTVVVGKIMKVTKTHRESGNQMEYKSLSKLLH